MLRFFVKSLFYYHFKKLAVIVSFKELIKNSYFPYIILCESVILEFSLVEIAWYFVKMTRSLDKRDKMSTYSLRFQIFGNKKSLVELFHVYWT